MTTGIAGPPGTSLSGRRSAAAFIPVLLLALTGIAWLAAPHAAAKGGEVTVRAAGDSPASVNISLSALGAPDVENRNYRLGSGTRAITGYSIARVLEQAASESDEIDLDRIPYVEVDRVGAGAPVRLSSRQINDPGAFDDGPPVFFEEDDGTVFVKPGSDGGAGSTVRFTNAAIGVTVGVDDDLSVALTTSPKKVRKGDPVTLKATVDNAPADQALEYRWSFGDGRSKVTSRASVTHTYGKAGSYSVVVTVTAGGASGQGAGTLKVGQPEPKKQPEKNSGGDGTGEGGSGGPGTVDGDPYGGSYGGSGLGTDYGIPGDYGYDYGSSQPGASLPPAISPAAPNPTPQTDPQPPTDDGLVPVAGELVSGTAPAPVTTIPAPGGADTTLEPTTPASDPAGIPAGVWMVGGALFLLGLGGLSEIRGFSRYGG